MTSFYVEESTSFNKETGAPIETSLSKILNPNAFQIEEEGLESNSFG